MRSPSLATRLNHPNCCPGTAGTHPPGQGRAGLLHGEKRENTQPQTDPGMLFLTCRRGNPNSSACGTPPASHDRAWARGSSGELPSHAWAWHCKETRSAPQGKGKRALEL
uniref:Uncharacterized protein n=1 Tax=Zonotrichia albicollis TaxID=44394 RepID=A0A8D2QJK4_ZONAL